MDGDAVDATEPFRRIVCFMLGQMMCGMEKKLGTSLYRLSGSRLSFFQISSIIDHGPSVWSFIGIDHAGGVVHNRTRIPISPSHRSAHLMSLPYTSVVEIFTRTMIQTVDDMTY